MFRGNLQESIAAYRSDRARWAQHGVVLPDDVRCYTPEEFRYNYELAMDALPTLVTGPNAGVPALLTTMIDPAVYEVLFAPNKAAEIFGEVRKGTWLEQTALFPLVEHIGEVTTYGDYAEVGHAGANTNWDQRQSYLFQTVKEYGELELERAGLARINWVGEIDTAAGVMINKFLNLTYFFGVTNLQNYGLTNDPNLPAVLTPAAKAAGGVRWVNNGVVVATANEIFTDIQSMFLSLINQAAGLVDHETPMTLALSPQSELALTATNTFNVNVYDLLKKNFPNLKVVTAVQYGGVTTQNSQGQLAGQLVQLIAQKLEGQDTGYCSFNEKMRSHPIIRAMSSYKQKVSAGSWGAIIRMPVAFAQLLGV